MKITVNTCFVKIAKGSHFYSEYFNLISKTRESSLSRDTNCLCNVINFDLIVPKKNKVSSYRSLNPKKQSQPDFEVFGSRKLNIYYKKGNTLVLTIVTK